jgi:hypothetical protein
LACGRTSASRFTRDRTHFVPLPAHFVRARISGIAYASNVLVSRSMVLTTLLEAHIDVREGRVIRSHLRLSAGCLHSGHCRCCRVASHASSSSRRQ